VHDIVNLEAVGVPGVMLASSEFADASATQAAALGADPCRLFVPHPIQDRTDAELWALADAAIDDALNLLTEE